MRWSRDCGTAARAHSSTRSSPSTCGRCHKRAPLPAALSTGSLRPHDSGRLQPRHLYAAYRELALPRVVDRFRKNPLRLLRRVEPGAVLRLDEVEHELCAALQLARQIELRVRQAAPLRVLDIADQCDDGLHGAVP